jgi:hypothetical protein
MTTLTPTDAAATSWGAVPASSARRRAHRTPAAASTLTKLLALCALLGIGLFTALLLAIGQRLIAGALAALLLVPIGALLMWRTQGQRHDSFFWLLAASIFLSSLASAITHQSFSFVSTGILLLVSPFLVMNVVRMGGSSMHLRLAWVLLALYYAIGLLSSINGRSHFVAAAYTVVMSTKPFLLVAFGAALSWSDRTDRRFTWLVRWLWLPLLLIALMQWFTPGLYASVLADQEADPENNPLFNGLPRARALFHHPSILAAVSSMFALICLTDALLQRRARLALPMLAYGLLLLMSGQRQELAAACAAGPLVWAVSRWRLGLVPLMMGAGSALALLVIALYLINPQAVQLELGNWGLAAGAQAESARAILYSDSMMLADRYWPWGSGFGTFGSVGAVRFDQSLFDAMGYGAFWWFTKRSFLMDAFWAKYIAEVGWLGFAAHVTFYLVIAHALLGWLNGDRVRQDPTALRRCLLALGGLAFVLLASPTAFVLAEPHGGLFALMFLGLAWQRVQQLRATPGAAAAAAPALA